MAFMTSNRMAEGSLATAFVMAIADLMDDGGSRDPSQKTKEAEKQEHQKRNESLECQKAAQQQIKTIGSNQPTTSYCSPYESLYWLGGDCIRETAHQSLSTINECTTMKTDNTTEMNHTTATTSPVSNNNNKESMHVPIVSPDKSSCSTASSSDSSGNEEHKHDEHEHEDNDYQNQDNVENHDQNDAIRSNIDGDSNSKAGSIISEYHNKFRAEGDSNGGSGGDANSKSNSKSLFDDYGDYLDYSDPMNSILVEDHNADLETYRIKEEELKKKIMRSYKTKTRSTAGSIFCPGVHSTTTINETEEEDWISKANASNSSLCGFYPSMLMYGDDDGNTPEEETSQKHPDYYAEFKPQRQYAFDEGDQVAGSAVSKTRNMLDGMSSTANSNDLNSVTSSVQSFMVIHRPHTSASATHLIPSTPLTEKLARNNSKHRSSSSGMITPVPHGLHNHHLHKLIASSAPGLTVSSPIPTPVPTDSESEGNPHRNHHNNDHDSLEEDNALTQSLMRKLQKHLPYGKRGDSFWLQYSLIRDGASLDSLLDMVHKDSNSTGIKSNSISSVLAIETVEGEVFGAFLTQTWRRSYNQWYGGGQSFLWTTAAPDSHGNSKRTGGSKNNTKIRVFPYSFKNSYVQLCDRDRLLVGGGDGGDNYEKHCYGFGLALEKDLLTGSSCPCTTFESPSLSKLHADGSTFEIRNVEVWTLTPCLTIIDNPSQGLVRVHKKDNRILQIPKPIPRHATTRNVEDEPDDGSSLSDCYSDCNLIDEDDMEDGRNLSTYTFPGAHKSAVRNRNVRRTNRNN